MPAHKKAICKNGHDTTVVGRSPSNGNCLECERAKARKHWWKKLGSGWTNELLAESISKQGGKCAICPNTFKNSKDAHADHDHLSGAPRQVLCQTCNQGLGSFKDSPELLIAAFSYLKKHGK